MSSGHSTILAVLLAAAGIIGMLASGSPRNRLSRAGMTAESGVSHRARGRIRRVLPRGSGNASRRRRSESDSLRLAVTWDLLAAALRSGMPVSAALRAASDSAPAAANEVLSATADLLALGAEPVEAWRQAASYPDTAELARTACRTARSGTALATAVAELAEGMRAGARDAARERSQRAGVLLTGPLGLCFLPAFLCLGVIPVVIGLASRLNVLR